MTDETSRTPTGDWLSYRAALEPDAIALVVGGIETSYRELDLQVEELARGLAASGVRAGSVVTLELPASLEFSLALHGLWRLGAVALPLNPKLAADERARVVSEADPALELRATEAVRDLAVLGTGLDDGGEIPFEGASGAPLARILTSGTSGAARQVELSRANFFASAAGSAAALGVEPDDRWLCCMPLFHVGGLSILTRSVLHGTAAEIHDGFDTARVASALGSGAVTGVSLVATQLKRLLDADADLSRPRAIVVGGGPVPGAVLEQALERGAAVLQTYGLTEACSQVTILAPGEALGHIGSSGRPIPGTEVRIETGEIWVRGATIARGSIADDGWLHTGDLGRLDDDGYLFVTDRLGDMIVTGGENVLPGEIEECLRAHPDVADAAVVGRPDAEWGEAVTAVIVATAGSEPDPRSLRAHCAERLAPHQVPKHYEFTNSLPRTASGKLRRKELR